MNEMQSDEDLREAQARYYERYPFPLFSHVDMRVRDADAVRQFYDALMPLFGTEPTTVRAARYGYSRRYGTVRAQAKRALLLRLRAALSSIESQR